MNKEIKDIIEKFHYKISEYLVNNPTEEKIKIDLNHKFVIKRENKYNEVLIKVNINENE